MQPNDSWWRKTKPRQCVLKTVGDISHLSYLFLSVVDICQSDVKCIRIYTWFLSLLCQKNGQADRLFSRAKALDENLNRYSARWTGSLAVLVHYSDKLHRIIRTALLMDSRTVDSDSAHSSCDKLVPHLLESTFQIKIAWGFRKEKNRLFFDGPRKFTRPNASGILSEGIPTNFRFNTETTQTTICSVLKRHYFSKKDLKEQINSWSEGWNNWCTKRWRKQDLYIRQGIGLFWIGRLFSATCLIIKTHRPITPQWESHVIIPRNNVWKVITYQDS